jgi:fructose-1,6-bisphosphatase
MITDLNCAVYEMRCNKYPTIEIADALHISDEEVELIDKVNRKHLAKLEMIRLGRLSLSDFN